MILGECLLDGLSVDEERSVLDLTKENFLSKKKRCRGKFFVAVGIGIPLCCYVSSLQRCHLLRSTCSLPTAI